MDRAQALNTIQEIIRKELNQPDLTVREDTTAHDVSGWDSMTHVQIIVAAERAFKFRATASQVAQMENVGSLVDLVVKNSNS